MVYKADHVNMYVAHATDRRNLNRCTVVDRAGDRVDRCVQSPPVGPTANHAPKSKRTTEPHREPDSMLFLERCLFFSKPITLTRLCHVL